MLTIAAENFAALLVITGWASFFLGAWLVRSARERELRYYRERAGMWFTRWRTLRDIIGEIDDDDVIVVDAAEEQIGELDAATFADESYGENADWWKHGN